MSGIWTEEESRCRELSSQTSKSITDLRPHWRVIKKIYGPKFGRAAVSRVVADVLTVASPVVLAFLIRYLASIAALGFVDDRPWYGYVLAVSLFIMQLVSSWLMMAHHADCAKLGFEIRTALIGATFQKMLRISPSTRSKLTTGKIINVIVSDTNRLDLACNTLATLYSAPLVLFTAIGVLLWFLGPSTLIGLAVLFAFLPLQNIVQKIMGRMRSQANMVGDQRLKITSESLSGIRVIKSYAWETSFEKVIAELRVKELSYQRVYLLLRSSISGMSQVVPAFAMITTFICYFALGNPLDPARIFPALSLFYVLRSPLLMMPLAISQATDAWISINRIEEILLAEELTNGPKLLPSSTDNAEPAVKIDNATFEWDEPPGSNIKIEDSSPGKLENLKKEEAAIEPTAVSETFTLQNINIHIKKGSLTAIIGSVGSGKSSLLQALVGEMRRVQGDVTLRGSMGWCPQAAWIFNATVKDNILFGQPYDEKKYMEVLKKCALESDLKILPAGDQTEIGERGINLSGGQKQRVSLARALYFSADIILLDDPLSAVDAHVSRFLFDNCIKGALSDKTRLLVTHQLHFLPQVDRVILLDAGRVVEDGTFEELMSNPDGELKKMMDEFGGMEAKDDDEDTANTSDTQTNLVSADGSVSKPDEKHLEEFKTDLSRSKLNLEDSHNEPKDKLITIEERQVGAVSANTLWMYIKLGGGLKMAFLILGSALLAQIAKIVTDKWLADWSYNRYPVSTGVYQGVYVALGFAQGIFLLIFSFALVYTGLWASQRMHDDAIESVFRAPLSFFDTTPLGRLITRYAQQSLFVSTNQSLLDRNGRMYYCAILLPCWLAMRLEAVSSILVFLAAIFAVVNRYNTAPGLAGLTISYAMNISSVFNWCVRQMATLEQDLNSIERLCFLIHDIDQEQVLVKKPDDALKGGNGKDDDGKGGNYEDAPKAEKKQFLKKLGISRKKERHTDMNKSDYPLNLAESTSDTTAPSKLHPPPEWPTQGHIIFDKVCMRYRPHLPLVLKELNLTIPAGYKVGIVGRTGAGKSSLIASLLRLSENASGTTTLDGMDISTVPIRLLRSRVAVIPQDPVLFSGTLRANLDPFGSYEDQELWEVLEASNLKEAVSAYGAGLDMTVAENGENFSVGQRQLVCLARAMLKKSRVVILDEATASVDLQTDEFIQNAIRRLFVGSTVVTIAHRLITVADYDLVCVMGAGKVVEVGEPWDLLEGKVGVGVFREMVKETGDGNEAVIRRFAKEAAEERAKRREGATEEGSKISRAVSKDDDERNAGVMKIGMKDMLDVVVDVTLT
ncbi:Canalicular multispecific organic anion transporter 2 [Chytridiales sp. JEL 0842]|nr:Canalicular multispecific organic anion transporter 2 [Chytridiales sp. JEL 0842]